MKEDEITRTERLKQKQLVERKLEEEQRQRSAQAKRQMKNRIGKYKEDLQKQEHDRRGDLYENLQQEEERDLKVKHSKDRWSNIHKRKLESVEQQKTEARDNFYEWCR